MNRISSVLSLAFVGIGTSCTSTTDSQATLVGNWVSRENLSPSGYYTTKLTFAADGAFTDSVRTFGCYSGQSGNDLCAYTIMSGTYSTQGDKLVTKISRTVTWDRFYGDNSPETVQNVNTSLFDQGHFRITSLALTLDYLSYPADAAEPTTRLFLRAD